MTESSFDIQDGLSNQHLASSLLKYEFLRKFKSLHVFYVQIPVGGLAW